MVTTSETRRAPAPLVTRRRAKLVVVTVGTLLFLYLSYRLAQPFLPALVWSVTAAVITQPLVRWLARFIVWPSLRAFVATLIVGLVVFVPVITLITYASISISTVVQTWNPAAFFERWNEMLASDERLTASWESINRNLDLRQAADDLVSRLQAGATTVVATTVYSAIQAALTLFILFFLYRDKDKILHDIWRLSPFTDKETKRVLKRVDDTIHATIFGIVTVALVQGTLGGIIFSILGLPAPVFWGTVMAMLAVVPYLGSFVIWVPAAGILAWQGDWGRAAILVAWGALVIGLIDNLLYPMLVGNRLRQHTVIAFIAIVGGITLFGATGIVLGPVVMSLTFFLLETWRRRTANQDTSPA